MDIKYILMIVCGAVFAATFIAFIIVYYLRKKKEEARAEELAKMYSDKNLAKMEYDCAVYDEETEKLIAARQDSDGQMTIEEVIKTEAVVEDSVFQTVDTEGLEEITGNYKPE